MHKLVEGVMTEVAPKEKPAKVKKKLPLSKLKYVAVIALVLVAIGVGAYLLLRDTRQVVDCKAVISNANTLFKEQKYKEYLQQFDGDLKSCTKESGFSTDKQKFINTAGDNATKADATIKASISFYKIGEKESAVKLADQALESSKSLSVQERARLSNSNLVMDVFMIKNGIYPQ